MANNYYNLTNPVPFIPGSKVRSDEVITEYNLVAAGFDLLPADPAVLKSGRVGYAGLSTGTGNTYTTLTGENRASDAGGDVVIFVADKTNTGASTLEVDGNGARALVDVRGNAMISTDIRAGAIYEARYDIANTRWQLVSPSQSGASSASLAQQWAVNPFNDDVDGYVGQYSALHWATASANSAAAAAASAALAGTFDPALYAALADAEIITGAWDYRNSYTQTSYAASTASVAHNFQKSRNATPGSHTLVQNDDSLGIIDFRGSDGTAFRFAARIEGMVDGTAAANDMPGRLVFSTSLDGGFNVIERLRIRNNGQVVMTADGFTYGSPVNLPGGVVPSVIVMSRSYGGFAAFRHSADSGGAGLTLGKTRSIVNGQVTAVAADDAVGVITFVGADGTNYIAAASIVADIDGNVGTNDMPGRLRFLTTPDGASAAIERMRITSTGRVAVWGGTATGVIMAPTGGTTPFLSVNAIDSGGLASNRNSADANPAFIGLGKSRSGTIGTQTIVQSGDELGRIAFAGSDGSVQQPAGHISVYSDGTPGANDMPGRMAFYTTPDGAVSSVERIRITNAGHVLVGTTNIGSGGLVLENTRTINFAESATESYANIFRQASSAALWLGMGYKHSVNANQVASSYGSSLAKAGIGIGSIAGGIQFFADSAVTTAVGTNVTPTERVRISSNGQVVVTKGGVYAVPAQLGGFDPGFAVQGNTVGGGWAVFTQFTNDTQPSALLMRKSRNATVGSHTVVVDGDTLGAFIAYGSDGTQFINAAAISAIVDGTPGTNDMPTRLVFSTTPNAGSSSLERLRIDNTGYVTGTSFRQAVKDTDTNRNSTTTLTDDTELTLASVDAGYYQIDVHLTIACTSDVPGFKWQVTQPGGNFYELMGVHRDQTNAYVASGFSYGVQPQSIADVNATHKIMYSGVIYLSTTGTVAIAWAQVVSNATNVTLGSTSYIKLRRLQ